MLEQKSSQLNSSYLHSVLEKKTNSKIAGSKDVFVCNACEKEDVQIVAHAVLDNLDENGKLLRTFF